MSDWYHLVRRWLPNVSFFAGHRYSMLSNKPDIPEIVVHEAPSDGTGSNTATDDSSKSKPRKALVKLLDRETYVLTDFSPSNS